MSFKSKAELMATDQFIEIIKNSSSCAEAMRKIGYTCTTGNANKAVHKRIDELGIDISHWSDNTKNARIAKTIPIEEYFIKGNIVRSNSSLKNKVLANNICEYKCAICGNIGFWQDKELVLQLHHIDGDRTNNSPENLQFLCPNCHSQTDNFAGKNNYNN